MDKETQTIDLLNLECRCNSVEAFIEIACLVLKTREASPRPSDIYKTMTRIAEQGSLHFPGDASLFLKYYDAINSLTSEQLLGYVEKLARHSALGFSVPQVLADYFARGLGNGVRTVLVTDCWQYGTALVGIVGKHPYVSFTLTCPTAVLADFYSCIYKEFSNVQVVSVDIYSYGFSQEKYDLICSVPSFGRRTLVNGEDFICKETDLVAIQNLLYHLNMDSELSIVVPARITFAAGTVSALRTYIEQNYRIKEIMALPNGLFHPYTGIRTYFLSLGYGKTDDVVVNRYDTMQELAKASKENEKLLFSDELTAMDDWNIDVLYAGDNPELQRYNQSASKKLPLADVASVFRGKAVCAKSTEGTIGLINISDLKDDGIDYANTSCFTEEERKVAKYALREGDVLISARGTTLKIAVFASQSKTYIPSSNMIVIRPGRQLRGKFLQLFFGTSAGRLLLDSLKRGTIVTNINHHDVGALMIPVPPLESQDSIIAEYEQCFSQYRQSIQEAESAWQRQLKDIQDKLY